MTLAKRISANLFNIYSLFTREPFINNFAKEIEYYSDDDGVLGVILIDLVDNDFTAILLSRNDAKQYRAESIECNIPTILEARDWIQDKLSGDRLFFHEPVGKFFDLFNVVVTEDKRHPFFEFLDEKEAYLAAKDVIKEISYHYKDIDGNYIQQFQSLNGFDARLWELFLFCFCREEYFSFSRNLHAPDFIIEKLGHSIALEAVIINRSVLTREAILQDSKPSTQQEIDEKMKFEMPMKYANALAKKLKKKYWELQHVKGKPLMFAIADFHAFMSMTWSFQALLEYVFGYKPSYFKNEKGEVIFTFEPIEGFEKSPGVIVPAGFFNLPESENVSAVLFSATATISKFNRMGKQAGLGSANSTLIRSGLCHNHDKDAVLPNSFSYTVDENSRETWAEGVSIFHNPKALYPIDHNLFPSCAHHFLVEGRIKSIFPEFLPYSSITANLMSTGNKRMGKEVEDS